MIDIRLEIPRRAETRVLSFLNPRRVRWAEKEAVNLTTAHVARFAHRLVAEEMGISPTKLRKRGRSARPGGRAQGTVSRGRRATTRRLFSTVNGYGKPFNVTRWNAQEVKEGKRVVGVTHKAWGRQQLAPRTWKLGVKGGPVVKRADGQVRGVFGPGVTHVMEYPHIMGRLKRRAQRRFGVTFIRRLRYAFSSQSHLRF